MKLNLDFTGATLLKEWWQTVKANFEAIQLHSTEAVIDHPDKSVTTEKIADYAVKTMKIANESVSAGKIATDAVRTMHLKDGNVTMAKLHSDVQTQLNDFQEHINNPSQEIAYRSVTKDKLSHEITSDLEKTLSTAEFINALYGCKVFLWTKNEMICPDENFPNELDIYENDKAIDENFAEDVWYLYKHDGTFSVDCFTYIGYETKTYYGLNKPFGAEGMYALRFHTTTPAVGTGIGSGVCEVIKLTSGDFESMINGGQEVVVDDKLSDTSANPVQNKVIKAELDKKYEIPNNNADTLLQSVGADQSGNGIQIGADVFIPCLVAGQGSGGSGFAMLDNVSFGETANVSFESYEGFDTLKGIIDAICDLREMVSALEG